MVITEWPKTRMKKCAHIPASGAIILKRYKHQKEPSAMDRCLLTAILFVSFAGQTLLNAQPNTASYQCEAPVEIRDSISQASADGIESMLKQDPENFWLLRAYIDASTNASAYLASRNGTGIPRGQIYESVVARFQKDYEAKPGDPKAAFLYAYSLIHRNTPKAIEILNDLAQKTPDFPYPYLTLAIIHSNSAFLDLAKQQKYTEEYLARCPDTIEPRIAVFVKQFNKSDILSRYAGALRARIAGNADEQTVPLYATLWDLESRNALPAGQAELNKRIESDLAFLEGLSKTKFKEIDMLLARGYKRIGNKEVMKKVLASSSPASNTSTTLFFEAESEWLGMNMPPSPTAGPDVRAAYYRKRLKFIDEWLELMPRLSTLQSLRITALASIPDTPDEVLVREGNQAMADARQSGMGNLPAGFLELLQVWAQRGLELNRIPALVMEITERQFKFPGTLPEQESDLVENTSQLMMEDMNWTTDSRAWAILVTAYAKTRQLEQARATLAEWEKGLNERRKKADELNEKRMQQTRTAGTTSRNVAASFNSAMENALISGISNEEAKYYNGCAQLAAAEGRSLDALTYYQSSLRLMYGRSMSTPNIEDVDAGKTANGLWKQLGGTEAGWKVWLDSLKTMSMPKTQLAANWSPKNLAIPQFSLTDQEGKTWTLDRLKGKTTLINIWATWCGPCRAEMVLLQKLHEQIKDRSDIQIITLNTDEDVNLVEPFLKENKFTMPSLFARSFVNEFSKPQGIPTSWISDATGTIRFESLGFGGDSSNWIPQILRQLESVPKSTK
jgi:thiol-disulfide isomerase/thioredoxin